VEIKKNNAGLGLSCSTAVFGDEGEGRFAICENL
jgi:hypothetical protein